VRFGDFKTQLVGFVKRDEVNNPVLLNFVVNQAKLRLQRDHDLVFCRSKDSYTYPSTTGVGIQLPLTFRGFPADKSVSVIDSGQEGAPMIGTTIEQLLRAEWPSTAGSNGYYYLEPRSGRMFLLTYPEALGLTVQVRSHVFLPDYTDDTEEDVLLRHGYDALFWMCLAELYLFGHEEDKAQLYIKLAQDAIISLNGFLSRMVASGTSIGG